MTVLAVLTVLAVQGREREPFFCLSCKIQDEAPTIAVLTVLAVMVVMAVSVVTATPLKLTPLYPTS